MNDHETLIEYAARLSTAPALAHIESPRILGAVVRVGLPPSLNLEGVLLELERAGPKAVLRPERVGGRLWARFEILDAPPTAAPPAEQPGGEVFQMLPTTAEQRRDKLRDELRGLLNAHSCENASNTPDSVLATHLLDCLDAFDRAVKARDDWYGIAPAPGELSHNTVLGRVLVPKADMQAGWDEPSAGSAHGSR